MSPYGSLSTIHRAEVRVPEDVYERFGHTREYQWFSNMVSQCVAASGANTYSEVIEWAEDPVLRNCSDFIDAWHNRILMWQEQMRSEA